MQFNFLLNKVEANLNPSSFWLRAWRPFALFLLFALMLYGQTLFFDFTYLDDNSLILDNAPILSQASLGDIFTNDVFFSQPKFYYRPILTLSLWLDFKLMQALPFWYHLVNIILQVIATGLLFVFLQKLKIRRTLAWWAAIIFLIHPALSSVVAWIPGRNDSLLAIFVLASFIFLEKFLKQGTWTNWLGHALFVLLALFTKESAVVLPVLILLYLFLFKNFTIKEIFRKPLEIEPEIDNPSLPETETEETPVSQSMFSVSQMAQKLIILVSTWLTALIFWFLPRSVVLENTPFNLGNLLSSIVNSFSAVFLYFGKIIMPLNLSVFPTLLDSPWWPGLLILILLIVIFSRFGSRPRLNYLIFGTAWFLLFLLPSLTTPDQIMSLGFFEHRLELPFIGALLILLELDFIKNLDFRKASTKISLSLLILILLLLNLNNSNYYRDRFAFWSSAARTAPRSAFVHSNLGAMYYLSGDLSGATKEYKKALILNYKEPMTHNNLGLVYLEQKNYLEAEKEFNTELAYNPNYDKTLFNLGHLYYLEKRYLEAAYYWQATLVVNPAYYDAYQYLLLLRNKIE